jgi:protein required for attachment to host cells
MNERLTERVSCLADRKSVRADPGPCGVVRAFACARPSLTSIVMFIGRRHITRWVLVGDASRARLYRQRSGKDGSFELLETFSHEPSRAKVTDLVTDLGKIGAPPETDAKEVEAQRFARELADVLSDGLNQHAYESLVVIAPSRFLGLLRASIGRTVKKRVEGTYEKDLTWLEPPQLERRLRAMMA